MEKSSSLTDEINDMFKAPINRSMKVLDRAFFRKEIPTTAVLVKNARDIPIVRKACGKSLLRDPLERCKFEQIGRRTTDKLPFLPLMPSVKIEDKTSIPAELDELVKEDKIELFPYTHTIDYDQWTADEILSATLPPDEPDSPRGFATAGHIAHLNLRPTYLPWKHLIAQVILDKNPIVKTVVNKTEDVGAQSEFRTFPMELLAGDPNTRVQVSSDDCLFDFDFAKVYWNTKLEVEHMRIVDLIQPGEAVCDVMAGVGPFAVPAAKRRKAMVWANDLNPDSYDSLKLNIKKNKVAHLVQSFNIDGRDFIRSSAKALLNDAGKTINQPLSTLTHAQRKANTKPEIYTIPQVFSRYIMNLPGGAVEFLDAFVGLYADQESLFPEPSIWRTDEKINRLPIVHVYSFSKGEEMAAAAEQICTAISHYITYPMTVDTVGDPRVFQYGDGEGGKATDKLLGSTFHEGKVKVSFVRRVAPKKSMYCATFRLPREVAFRNPRKGLSNAEKEEARKKEMWMKVSDSDDEDLEEKLKRFPNFNGDQGKFRSTGLGNRKS